MIFEANWKSTAVSIMLVGNCRKGRTTEIEALIPQSLDTFVQIESPWLCCRTRFTRFGGCWGSGRFAGAERVRGGCS